MKKLNLIITNLVLITIFAAIGCISAMAQRDLGAVSTLVEETRPFDFSDKYYEANGVQPYLIINRANGADGKSVFTKNANENYRDIRFVETLPAYNYDGSILYFNNYGELFDRDFVIGASGDEALQIAQSFPMFVFPSTTVKASNRQASLIDAHEGYFEKNVLGLSVVVEVEYTGLTGTKEAALAVKSLGERNGYSLDGTPIIKTVEEINYLTRLGVVTQKIRGIETRGVPSYAIVKAIEPSKTGAIAPDAFLSPVTKPDGQPLDAEAIFVINFNCMQNQNETCSD
jgi:hypothetical protein